MQPQPAKTALVLIAHGTVERLDELPVFLRAIRQGREAPAELLAEVRRRYEAIGGHSPLGDITTEVAARLEVRLKVPVRKAFRLAPPFPSKVLEGLIQEGIEKIAVIPLAQHSAWVYREAIERAASELVAQGKFPLTLLCAENWGQEPGLTAAFASELQRSLEAVPFSERALTTVIMTAHSLPLSVIQAGDPYATEVRASAEGIARELSDQMLCWELAFQSQGLGNNTEGKPMEWLGPGLESVIDQASRRGDRHVLIAPIGFLADHVEILYDIDIEARAWALGRGLAFSRTASLNASEALLDVLESLGKDLLAKLSQS